MKALLTIGFSCFCLLSLGGCYSAAGIIAQEAAPSLIGGVVGQAQASSMATSDADTAKYVLPSQITAEAFVHDVRTIASSTGFSIMSASSVPMPNGTMTMMMLSKHAHFGLFENAYISLSVTLQPDGTTVDISSTVHGSKKATPDAVIGEFKKALAAKYKST